MPKNPDEIGALWMKSGKKGDYMAGVIDGIGAVVLFPVASTSPKAPQWRVLKSRPKEDAPPLREAFNANLAQTQVLDDDDLKF